MTDDPTPQEAQEFVRQHDPAARLRTICILGQPARYAVTVPCVGGNGSGGWVMEGGLHTTPEAAWLAAARKIHAQLLRKEGANGRPHQPCPGCVRLAPIACRGLCRLCYRRFAGAVASGQTTWSELEQEGRARPPRYPKYPVT